MKKRTLTLLEIMIVIFLITLITGTIGYSMRGTLDKGRAFRTEQGKEQLHDMLLLCLSEHPGKGDEIARDPEGYLSEQGLAKDAGNLIYDGWKEKFSIAATANGKDFIIKSDSYIKYKNRQNRNAPTSISDEDEE